MTKILELINIKKDFKQGEQQNTVLKNINLEINQGELVALTGPSGAGKTTLLQIAGLLDSPSSGEIYINGSNLSQANDKTRTLIRKNNIGFIYQFHHLLPEFSALENVALPLLIQGLKPELAFDKAKKILQEVNLSQRVDYKPSQLSGGQQQRVAIARAVVGQPSLILADEPTGNLDSKLSQKIFDLLQTLVKNYKIACLVVTHNLKLAKQTNKIFEIKDGEISHSHSN